MPADGVEEWTKKVSGTFSEFALGVGRWRIVLSCHAPGKGS
jgi:hypothetical protein